MNSHQIIGAKPELWLTKERGGIYVLDYVDVQLEVFLKLGSQKGVQFIRMAVQFYNIRETHSAILGNFIWN